MKIFEFFSNLFFVFFVISIFFSCKKKTERNNIEFSTTYVGENINLEKIIFLNDSVGFCCGGAKNTYGAIFKTSDFGKSWSKKFQNQKYAINDVFFLNDSIGFACGDSLTIYKTRDSGNNWSKFTFANLPWFQFMVPLNSLYFFSEEVGFAIGGEHFGKGSISRTFDGGKIWHHPCFDSEFNCVTFTDNLTGYFGGYGIILKTTDGGHSFNPCNIHGDWYISLSFSDNYNGFAAGYNGGLYHTTNGGENWETRIKPNSVFNERIHFKHILVNRNNAFISGTNGIFLISSNSGSSWKKNISFCTESLNCAAFTNNHKLFICSETGYIYSSFVY